MSSDVGQPGQDRFNMPRPYRLLRKLIWLYFFLWLIEGALRFWVFPALYGPLALIRDPLVMVIYLEAIKRRAFVFNGYVGLAILTALIALPLALIIGHGNLAVALFGVRANFLHLPLIFVIGRVLDEADFKRLTKYTLIVAIPMTVIAVKQFQSPAEAEINRGGMATHYGTVRPAGTFAFVSAMVYFTTLLTAFTAFRLMHPVRLWRWYTPLAAICLAAMVLVSGSRTCVVCVAVICLLAAAVSLRSLRQAVPLVLGLAFMGMIVALVSSAEFIEAGSQQLSQRFKDAGAGENVLNQTIARLSESTVSVLSGTFNKEPFGQGIGIGTNYGGSVLTGNRGAFVVGESEWDRILGELGIYLGLPFILSRLFLVFKMAAMSFTAHRRHGDPLPLLLFGVAWLPILAGQWGVPALQGFASISAGLVFAAARIAKERRQALLEMYEDEIWESNGRNTTAEDGPENVGTLN